MRALGNPGDLPQYLIDFKSSRYVPFLLLPLLMTLALDSSPFILFPREDTLPFVKAEVSFHFICYSNHQKEDFE